VELEVICGVWCPTRVEIRNGIGFDGAVFEGWLPDRMSYWLAMLYEEWLMSVSERVLLTL